MALETFNPAILPDVGSGSDSKFRINKASFGDGYIQRSGSGINTLEEDVTLNWSFLTETEVNDIKAFFDARGGYEAFNYTMPGESTPTKFICERYRKRYAAGDNYDFIAQLERVYDL